MTDTNLLFGEAAAAQAAGQLDRAMTLYRELLSTDGRHVPGLINLATIHLQQGEPGECLPLLDAALQSDPRRVQAHYVRGNALATLQRPAEALDSFDRALALKPGFAEGWYNRGVVLHSLGQFDEALVSYDRALALQPEFVTAHNNRGVTLDALDRHAEAAGSFGQALALQPGYAEAHAGLGNSLGKLERFAEALESFDRALALKTEFAQAWYSRGVALHSLRRFNEAFDSYERAIRARPEYAEAHWNKGLLKLRLGEFEEGWRLYEWRWRTPGMQPFARHFAEPCWTGREDLRDRTVLIHAEQGLGDVIQFGRYVSQVQARGARVILEVQPPLVTLLTTLSPAVRVVARGEALPPFDYHCPIMSLPLAFRTTLATVPAQVPYLRADPRKVKFWREKLGTGNRKRVGLAWSGGVRPGPPSSWAPPTARNIPLAMLAPLRNPDIEFFSLQKGQPGESELAGLLAGHWNGPRITDLTGLLEDFSDTAALIEQLDLVVSVDTSVVHLAGALAKPVWILDRHDNCWRWLVNRTDSPWYPTARLYRQSRPGDWAGVVAAVAADLRRL